MAHLSFNHLIVCEKIPVFSYKWVKGLSIMPLFSKCIKKSSVCSWFIPVVLLCCEGTKGRKQNQNQTGKPKPKQKGFFKKPIGITSR